MRPPFPPGTDRPLLRVRFPPPDVRSGCASPWFLDLFFFSGPSGFFVPLPFRNATKEISVFQRGLFFPLPPRHVIACL